MIRSLSSCFEDANVVEDGPGELGKEPFNEVEPRSVLGREGKSKAAFPLGGKPGFGLFGDVR